MERDGWPDSIFLDRIQTLTLIESPSSGAAIRDRTLADVGIVSETIAAPSLRWADRDSMQVASGHAVSQVRETPDTLSVKTDDMGTSRRIASKLVAGAVVGNLSFFGLMPRLASGCGDDGVCGAIFYIIGMSTVYPVGTALGLSLADPRSQFAASLLGSMLGIGVGFGLGEEYGNIWPLFVCPSVFATIMSELSRFDLPPVFMSHNSPEVSRFSVGLMPGPKGNLSVVTTLRF